jgi:hypothetical protein
MHQMILSVTQVKEAHSRLWRYRLHRGHSRECAQMKAILEEMAKGGGTFPVQ